MQHASRLRLLVTPVLLTGCLGAPPGTTRQAAGAKAQAARPSPSALAGARTTSPPNRGAPPTARVSAPPVAAAPAPTQAPTDAELMAASESTIEGIQAELREAGLITPGKVMAVFYGADGVPDGEEHIGIAHTGFGVTFLKSSPNHSLKGAVTGGAWESVMLHEIVHAIGMSESDATAHVFDTPDDLMATRATSKPNVLLDLNNDNYFRHGLSERFDLSKSLLLKRPPADARPPRHWPFSVLPAADGRDPMAAVALPAVDSDVALENALIQALNEERTKAGFAKLTVTDSLQAVARATADAAARLTTVPFNLATRAGRWGTQLTFSISPTEPVEAASIQGLVDQLLSPSLRRTQLLDLNATELAVGAVRVGDKTTITVAIGKAAVDVRRLRIGATPYGVYTFSGEARALKKLTYPLLYTKADDVLTPFPTPLTADWTTFVVDAPHDGRPHHVELRHGDRKVSQELPIKWTFDGSKPPGEAMDLPSLTRPVLAMPPPQPLPVLPTFE